MNYDIIIIGAGASGMMAGIVAARNDKKVLIIDKNSKTGRKIYATGNGKCNYTNMKMGIEYFNSCNLEFVKNALGRFSEKDTVDFFKKIGIYPKEKNGYVYPYSEQSASIAENMTDELKYLGVDIKLEENVRDLQCLKDGSFKVITDLSKYTSKKIIVAAGGKAGKKFGTDGYIMNLMKKMGYTIKTEVPGLVALKVSNKDFNQISGVRLGARVRIISDNKIIAKEEGEIIFNDSGISGIPVMQVSRFAANSLK